MARVAEMGYLDDLATEEASTRRSGVKCWVCGIPERAWVEKARSEGRTITVIVAVLVRQGYPPELATIARVYHHLRTHVR